MAKKSSGVPFRLILGIGIAFLGITFMTLLMVRSQQPVDTNLSSFAANVTQPVNIGVISDSTSDEYRANDNRAGGTSYAINTLNWLELLVKYRSINAGAWGTRSEPRRTGFEYNWARSGATVSTAVSGGQHTGLAGQVKAGLVNVVYIQLGSNDFAVYENREGYQICNGRRSTQDIQNDISSFLNNLGTIVRTIQNAGSAKIIIATVGDPTGAPHWASSCSRPELLRSAVASVNSQIKSYASANGIIVMDLDGFAQNVISRVGAGGAITIGGEKFDAVNGGNEPHHVTIGDNIHAGTVFSGLFANDVIGALNTALGSSLAPFTDSELLVASGIRSGVSPTVAPTPSPKNTPTASPIAMTPFPTVRPTTAPVPSTPQQTTVPSKQVKKITIVNTVANRSMQRIFLFDGILEDGKLVDVTSNRFTYSGAWVSDKTHGIGSSPLRYTTQNGASVTFMTSASTLVIESAKYSSMGGFDVFIDGSKKAHYSTLGSFPQYFNVQVW